MRVAGDAPLLRTEMFTYHPDTQSQNACFLLDVHIRDVKRLTIQLTPQPNYSLMVIHVGISGTSSGDPEQIKSD